MPRRLVKFFFHIFCILGFWRKIVPFSLVVYLDEKNRILKSWISYDF